MPEKTENQLRFESEYKGWLRGVAGDVASRMFRLPGDRREGLLEAYRKLEDPGKLFFTSPHLQRITELVGEQASNFIMVETEGITIFPSIYSSAPNTLDFALAMSRRFYLDGLWYPIIALNSAYVEQSTDKMLAFALEHEFQMSRIYEDISLEFRAPSPGEKKLIADAAENTTIGKLNIIPDELRQDEALMLRLTEIMPLIPKPYSEMALLCYLEDNVTQLCSRGIKSRSEDEEAFGRELFEEFNGWRDVTRSSYLLYVSEVHHRLRDSFRGYV
ncbi:MAG: hypothetical protein GKC10_01910 [Methanosarcinales archaeon]|nr:hypothetical protein [Methanosarcinales archaeon]